MKRIVLSVMAGLSVVTGVQAQSDAELIRRAVLAAPPAARETAMVVKWSGNTYTTIREGTGLVCYDHSGAVGEQPFSVQCTDPGNLPRVAQNYQLEAAAAGNREALNASLAAAESNGTRVRPVFGSAWLSMSGADEASARRHTTIAVPGATQASMGLPESRSAGAWIMNAGTSTAHIMIPGA
jgi:hypothetical protein